MNLMRMHSGLTSSLLTAILMGCGGTAAVSDRGPTRLEVVCADAAACSPAELTRLFDGWITEADALRQPGSRFIVYQAPTAAGTEPSVRFTTCVPASWGGDVRAKKAAFESHARGLLQRVNDAPAGEPTATDCGPPPADATADGARLVVRVRASDIDLAVRQNLESVAIDGEPVAAAVICDASLVPGTSDAPCNPGTLASTFLSWLQQGGMRPDASFTLWGVRDPSSSPVRLRIEPPAGRTAGHRLAALLARRAEVASFARGLGDAKSASAIAQALHTATAELQKVKGHRAVVALSDLRQRGPGTLDLEIAAPSPAAFAAALAAAGLSLDMRGLVVRVCGLHARSRSGRFDPKLATAVTRVWQETFAAAASVTLDEACPSTLALLADPA